MLKKLFQKLIGPNKASSGNEGTVKFFNRSKGFGFIIIKDSEKEIFVHSSNLIDKIKEGDQVTFDVEQDKKGPIATNVRSI